MIAGSSGIMRLRLYGSGSVPGPRRFNSGEPHTLHFKKKGDKMPVHLEFDDAWLAEYCKRTGQVNPLDKSGKAKGKKRSKYGNRKTKIDGVVYDSAREAKRHSELALMQKAGEICGWAEQVTFLLPGGVKYRADFVVLNNDGTWAVEDAKGMRTKEYVLKKRLMAAMGIEIREV